MTESAGDYALLFQDLKENEDTDPVEYLEYLFSRTSVIIEDSSDEEARNIIAQCRNLLKPGKFPPSDDAVQHLRNLLENYGDEEHLRPPNKEYYFFMPMMIGSSAVEYSREGDDAIFTHICDQYATMLQVVNYLIDGSGVYAADFNEVYDRFVHKAERNTYFEQFSRLVNKDLQ